MNTGVARGHGTLPAPARAGRAVRYILLAVVGALVLSTTMSERAESQSAQPSGQRTSYPGGIWEPGPAAYGTVIVDEVPVTMDDGVVLRASVAYPTDLATGQRAAGQFPVVVEHTPYVTLAAPINPIALFTEHGYITAVVRARGAGTSGGELQFAGPRDGQDGKSIVDWAAYQVEGSDGRVALIGCSYPARLALGDAAAVGPNSPLKAVVAACNGLEGVQRQSWRIGGLPTAGFNRFVATGTGLLGNSPSAKEFFDHIGADTLAGGDMAYERAFWQERAPMSLAQDIVNNGVPVLLWAGWEDVLDTAAHRTYTALQNASAGQPVYAQMRAGQPTTPRYQLIIGAGAHAQGLDMGVFLQWLETWVKGVDTGIQNTATPLHLLEKGTDRWINAAQYPLVPDYTPWHLGEAGALMSDAPATGGGYSLLWGDPALSGSKVTITTPPLREGATLAGPISATIYASSSNTNLVMIARLYDVSPDGSAALVTKGAMLGSQRTLDPSKSWTDQDGTIIWPWPVLQGDEYLTPGEVYQFDISLAPRQWGVNPGHQLRLELTTQSPADVCPPDGPPPGNVTDPCRLTAPQQATVPGGEYTIMHGPEWPSALNLAQLPLNYFPAVAGGTSPTAWDESRRTSPGTPLAFPLDWGNNER